MTGTWLVAVVAVLLAATPSSLRPAWDEQSPRIDGHTALESAYVHLANDIASATPRHGYYTGPDGIPAAAALCEKINPNAVELSVAWGGFQSWRHYYTQSDCFYQVGANGKAPDVCDRVRELDVPPMKFHLSRSREDRLTKAECQQKAIQDGGSGGEYGTELMMLLLGYSQEEIAAGGRGYPPEHGGAYEFKRTQLDGGGDTGEDYSRLQDLLRRVQRLPDFSRGDDAGKRQLDGLVPGWASPSNSSRLAVALRCAVQRLPPGERLPTADCRDRF